MNADTARAIMPTGFGWEPYRTLSNDERRGQWAMNYYGYGHHRTTATTPAGDTDANRQDGTPAPFPPQQPRRAAIADAATFYDPTDEEDYKHPSGRQLTYDELANGF